VPVAGAGEAIVRPLLVALTRVERDVCRGLGAFRGVLGREFVGRVESVVGADERGLLGRRIVAQPSLSCGACDRCVGGLRMHCRKRLVLGMQGRDGALAELCAVPLSSLVLLPDSVDDEAGSCAALVAAAMQVRRQITVEGKPFITVLGDGPLGLVTVQVLAKLNASVRLIGRHASRLARCEKWGIRHRLAGEIGHHADQDVVVDCTGSDSGLELALRIVRSRGTIIRKTLLPRANSSAPPDLSPLVSHEITLAGSGEGPVGEAVGALSRGEVDVVSLLTGRVAFEQVPAWLHASGRAEELRVVTRPA